MKRIAILVPKFTAYSGAAQVAEIQAKELVKEGHQVDIITFFADIPPSGFTVQTMGVPAPRNTFWQRLYMLLFPLDLFKTLKWLPRLKEYDEIIVHLYPLTWFGYLAKKLYNVKYTFWYHGITPPHLFPKFYERIYVKLSMLFTKLTTRNVDRAVAVSRYAQKEMRRYFGLEGEVIYNKVDLSRFHPAVDGTKVREQHNLGDDPVILFVGALRPVKGVHLLIQAFKLVKQKIPQAKLVIVGRPEHPYYFEQLKRMSDKSVIFAGYVPQEMLPSYYAACDVYASCSLWEAHNVTALEAQACGKPIIVWHESFRETINKDGVLVEIGNIEKFAQACIRKLLQIKHRDYA